MGLFSRKNKFEPEDFGAQIQPVHDPVPGLPQNDQTVQNANIDGILPATTQTGHPQQSTNYTGFDEPSTQNQGLNDDQSQFIMDPVPEAEVSEEIVEEPLAEIGYSHETTVTEVSEPEFVEPDTTFSESETYSSPVENVNPVEPALYEATSIPADHEPHRHTSDDELAELKAEALKQLTPLAQHLDQSPEEKFHTTMMMLQATDDQNLVKTAFEAANSITDEKSRAQALLDVINEINYFTQNK